MKQISKHAYAFHALCFAINGYAVIWGPGAWPARVFGLAAALYSATWIIYNRRRERRERHQLALGRELYLYTERTIRPGRWISSTRKPVGSYSTWRPRDRRGPGR